MGTTIHDPEDSTLKVQVDASGNLQSTLGTALSSAIDSVSILGGVATYRAAGAFQLSANTDAVICEIQGSATKTIEIVRISAAPMQATAGVLAAVVVQRRSSSYGTGASVTPEESDTSNSAVSAQVRQYATVVAPSAANLVASAGLVTTGSRVDLVFGDHNDQALVLRGTGEYVAVYVDWLLGSPSATPVVTWTLEWREV